MSNRFNMLQLSLELLQKLTCMLFSFVLGTIPGHPNDERTAEGAPAALAHKFAPFSVAPRSSRHLKISRHRKWCETLIPSERDFVR